MSADTIRGKAAIAGVADAASPTGDLELHGRALEAAMVREALDDAGLGPGDVDGLFAAGEAMGLAEFLGMRPRWLDSTMTGGSSFEFHVQHAATAIALGLCDVAVSVYASTPHSDGKRAAAARASGGGGPGGFGGGPGGAWRPPGPYPAMAWEMPYGLRMPIGAYALAASRHMSEFGSTAEQLAQIAVSTREWATRNPRARFQQPLTVDEVLASELICSPLHKLDCCLRTDGAGAFVMTSAERARDLAKPPVYVLGAGSGVSHSIISQMPDLLRNVLLGPGSVASARAFGSPPGPRFDLELRSLLDAFVDECRQVVAGLLDEFA